MEGATVVAQRQRQSVIAGAVFLQVYFQRLRLVSIDPLRFI